MELSLESLVQKATSGDRAALEEIVAGIKDRVYGLALRMLWHPADAEDATQEILVRIITNLSSFRGESALTTWVYRVASNYLLTTRKRRAEHQEVTFERFGKELDEGLSDEPVQVSEEVEHRMLVDEVRIGCTHGMFLCLDRDHRIAYILGEIVELNSEEGGFILGITPAAFRKRLSRARSRLLQFMQQKCGIFNLDNACRCVKRVDSAMQIGRVDPENLLFARPEAEDFSDVLDRIHELEELSRVAAIYQKTPAYAAPSTLTEYFKELIDSEKFAVLGQ